MFISTEDFYHLLYIFKAENYYLLTQPDIVIWIKTFNVITSQSALS